MPVSPEVVNTLGLLLDIVGVVLLFRFGLPPDVSRTGAVGWTLGTDEAEALKARRYDCWSWTALALIVTGFVLQIIAAWMK